MHRDPVLVADVQDAALEPLGCVDHSLEAQAGDPHVADARITSRATPPVLTVNVTW